MGGSISRRRVLQQIAATGVVAPAVLASWCGRSFAALPPLPKLAASEGTLLLPSDHDFNKYEPAYNQIGRAHV